MTDFELQRDLRGLRGPREPQHDLWPQIAQRIAAEARASAPPRRRTWLPFAAAAAITLAVSAGIFSLALQRQVDSTDAGFASFEHGPSVQSQIERARELAASGDPRLASAEVVIDVASEELEQALQQQPDAVFLVGLINRTHAQRRKLARLGINAG
jgi:hypothetical protein